MDNPLSTIAHKLRTPLTVITSTVNNLLDGTFGSLNADQKKWLKKLEGHASHLEQLLNQILDFMREDPAKANRVLDRMGEAQTSTPATFGPTEDSTPTHPGSMTAGRSPLVLVVDDEDDIRDVVKEGLTMKGFRVLSASNGEEGLRLALTEKPDVILMDVLLGAENGIDVERKIKNQLSSFVPVILMTGQDDLREKITGGNSEPDELLAKPFQMEELFSRVRSMTRLKKMMDEIERTRQKSHNPKARENS